MCNSYSKKHGIAFSRVLFVICIIKTSPKFTYVLTSQMICMSITFLYLQSILIGCTLICTAEQRYVGMG